MVENIIPPIVNGKENYFITYYRLSRSYPVWFGCLLALLVGVIIIPQDKFSFLSGEIRLALSIPIVLGLHWFAYSIAKSRAFFRRNNHNQAELFVNRDTGKRLGLPIQEVIISELGIIATNLKKHEAAVEKLMRTSALGISFVATATLWAFITGVNASGQSPYVSFACLFNLCMLYSTLRYGKLHGQIKANELLRAAGQQLIRDEFPMSFETLYKELSIQRDKSFPV